MNRAGLAIALTIAVVVGVVFAVHPRLDIDISALFYNRQNNLFDVNAQPWVNHSRAAARWLITLIFAPACLAVIGKLLMPKRRMLIGGRAALLLIVTMAFGPGVLTNLVLKDHWGRARPIDITQLGGTFRFTPWWDPRGECPNNCSFVAGEPSGAFWTVAPAALAPPQWRLLAYSGALAFGAAVGLLRIAGGATFFQRCDVCRRLNVSHDLGDPRLDLSLASDSHQRRLDRAPARRSRRGDPQWSRPSGWSWGCRRLEQIAFGFDRSKSAHPTERGARDAS